jgi:Mrp family chromosome partitioning ATPase
LPSVNTQVSEDEGGCYADLMKSLIAEFPTKQEGTLLFVTPPAVQIADAVLKLAKEAALLGEVVLVEAKENSGNLQRWLGLQESPGWQDVVSGKAELEDCLQDTNIAGLKVVTAGSRNGGAKNGPRLIARSPRGLIRTLRKQHRLILIDGGIWSEESGSLGLARECDGICLLVPASKSGSATVEEILGRIEDSGSRLAGVLVLPNQDRSRSLKKAA